MSQLSLCQFNSWIISTMFSSGLLPLPSLQILSLSLFTMCLFLSSGTFCSWSTPRKMFRFLVNFKSFLRHHGPPDVVLFKLLSSVRDLLFCSLSLWPNVLTYLLQHTSPDISQTWKENETIKKSGDVASNSACPSDGLVYDRFWGILPWLFSGRCRVKCCSEYRGVYASKKFGQSVTVTG